mgnify:CR=1 FL=1
MEEKETLWTKMFKETDKEQEIQKRIDEEMENYKNSPEHVAHHKRMDALFDELHNAKHERLADAKEYRKQHFPRKSANFIKETEEQHENRLAELRKKKEERIASLPENLRNVIALYNSLSDNEKKVFGKEAIGYDDFDLDNMVNKQITHEQTRELQDILVQTCIDFINENELKDVDAVYFSADSLQESARCNEWTISTDSFLTLEGMEYDEKCDFHVRRLIDKSF